MTRLKVMQLHRAPRKSSIKKKRPLLWKSKDSLYKASGHGFGAILNIVKQGFEALSPAFIWLKDTAVSLADILLTISAQFGDWLVNLSDSIRKNETFTKVIGKLGETVKPVTDKITELISKLKEKLNTDGFNIFDETLGKIWKKLSPINKLIGETYTKVQKFFSEIHFSDTLSSIWDFVKNIADSIWDLVKGIDLKGIGNAVLTVFRSIGTGIKNIFSNFNVGKFLTDLGTGISNLLNSLGKGDFSNLFENLTKSMLLFGGFNLGSLFGAGSDALENLSGGEGGFLKRLLSPVTGIFDQLKETIGSFTKDTDDGKLKSIAIAIGILAASLVALSMIDSEKIDTALIGMAGAMAALTAEVKYLSGFSLDKKQTSSMKNVALAMIEISAAVAIMAIAIKPLAEMDWEELAKAGAGMTAIMGIMTAFIAIFGAISRANTKGVTDSKKGIFSLFQKSNGFDKQMIKVAESMILMGAAMKIFASVMKDIGSMKFSEWAKGIGGITLVMAEMLGFTYLVSKIDTKSLMKTMLSMVVFGEAMKIFASSVQSMGIMNLSDVLQGVGIMALIMAEMGAFILVGSLTSTSASHIAGLAASMIILGIAMKTFGSAMKDFAELEPVQWLNAISQMGLVFAGMLAFITVASLVAAQSGQILVISASMIVLGIAMREFAKAVKDFSDVKWGDLGKAGASMAGFVAILTAMGLLVGPLSAAVGILTGIGVALMAIGAGLTLIGIGLAAINIGLLAGQISMVTEEVRALLKELRANVILDNITKLVQIIPQMITGMITGIVAGIISGLGMILGSIGDLLDGFTKLVLAFLDSFKEIAPSMVDTFLVIILEVLDSLAKNLPEILVKAVDLIVKLLDGLIEYVPKIVAGLVNLLCKVIDSLTEHIPTLMTSFMKFAGALFGEILKALDASQPDAVIKMIELVGFISALIVACALLKTMIPAAMVGLVELGLFVGELSLIIAALGALNSIPGFEMLVNKGGNLLGAIGTALGQFVGGIVGGIAKGATAALPDIANHLSIFMTNLQPFLNGIKSLDALSIDAIKILASAILMLTAADILNGITSFFRGGNSFAEFGTKLAEFGPHFRQFADSVKGIDGEAVSKSSDAIVKIADVFNHDTFRSGGLKQLITGGIADLEELGKNLAAAAPNLVKYADIVKNFDDSGIETSGAAITKIAESYNQEVFKSGGLHQLISGQTDLAEFAKGLLLFAPSLVSYSDIIAGLDKNVIDQSAIVCNTLTEIINNFPEKSLISRIFGFDTVSDFVNSLTKLGEGIGTYYQQIASVDTSQMSSITKAVGDLLDIASGNGEISVSIKKNFGENMYKTASEGIEQFFKAITDSYDKAQSNGSELLMKVVNGVTSKKDELKNEINSALENALQTVKDIQDKFKNEGLTLVKNMKDGAESQKSGFTSAFSDMLNNVITIVKGKYRLFHSLGEDLITNVSAGINSKAWVLKNDFKSIVDGLASSIDVNSLYSAGGYLIDGLVSGILDFAWKVSNAIDSISDEAIETFKQRLGIASPSKVFYELGSYTGEGFLEGLLSWTGKIRAETNEFGDTVVSAMTEALADAVQDDIDTDPVIRPVLDLSDIEDGSKKLNNMISSNKAFRTGVMMDTVPVNTPTNSINNSRNFGGFTFNIYTQGGGNAEDIAKQIGLEVNRRIRQFGTI